jgi:hypothetical protein
VLVLVFLPLSKSHGKHFCSKFFAERSPEFHAAMPDEVKKLHVDQFAKGIACEKRILYVYGIVYKSMLLNCY